MHHNNIHLVEGDGLQIVNHEGKTIALTDYFWLIIGQPRSTAWRFDVGSLFSRRLWSTTSLTDNFSKQETEEAILSMNRNSGPSLDGFGPAIYWASSQTIKPKIGSLWMLSTSEKWILTEPTNHTWCCFRRNPGWWQLMHSDLFSLKTVVSKSCQKYSLGGCIRRFWHSSTSNRLGFSRRDLCQKASSMLWS